MGALKEIALRGAYFIEIGARDPDPWSQLMIEDLGPNVRPMLYEIRQWSLIISQKKAGNQSMKLNCWEFHKCGREAGGGNIRKLGICPVYLHAEFDGIHGGRNGGRACWIIQEARCGGKIRRACVPHDISCMMCEFRKLVLREQSLDSVVSNKFLQMLID